MTTLAIAEYISAFFVTLTLIGLYLGRDRSKSMRRLRIVYILTLFCLLADAICYTPDVSASAYWLIYICNLLAYTMSNIVLIFFLFYCEAYIGEKTKLSKWTFRIPMIVLLLNVLIEVIYFFTGRLVRFENGQFVEVGTVPFYVMALATILLFYAPIVAFIKRKDVGLGSVVLLGSFGIPIIVAIILIPLTGWDLTILAGAVSISAIAAVLQLDLSKLKIRSEAEHMALSKNYSRVLALEDKLEFLYDVNLENGSYETYVKGKTIENINANLISTASFFEDVKANAEQVIYEDDRAAFLKVADPSYFRKVLEENSRFDWYYRVLSDGNPVWADMRVLYKGRDKKNILVAIFNAEEEVAAMQKEDRQRKELINQLIGEDGLFIIDCEKNTRKTIHDETYGASYYTDTDDYTESIEKYISNYVAESDRPMMRNATDPAVMMDRLKDQKEYRVEYRDTTTGIQRFYEMKIVRFSETEVLQSFKENDKEIFNQLMFDKLEDDFMALFSVDLDTGLSQVIKKSPWHQSGEPGTVTPYAPALRIFSYGAEGETREFFDRISSIEYLKKCFAKDEKLFYLFKSYAIESNTWINATGYVLARHDDGVPSLLALGFSVLDEVASNQEELKLKIRESMNVVGGLASEFTALYHVNLDTGSYVPYHLIQKSDSSKPYVSKHPTFSDLVMKFAESSSVHPDYRDELIRFFPSEEEVRQSLTGLKKLSMLFKSNVNGEYLWTEADIIKCEDAEDEAHNVIVGFIEKDEEIKRELEAEKLKKQSEDTKKLINNVISDYNIAYAVNLKEDTFKVLKKDDRMIGRDEIFDTFTDAKNYFITHVLHESDRERIKKELDYDIIRQKLAIVTSYKLEYRALMNGATIWHEMSIMSFNRDEVVICFAWKNLEITRRRLEGIRYDEFFALFVVDLDTEMIQPTKTSPLFKTVNVGESVPYESAMKSFAGIYKGETKDFFLRISDIDYVRRDMAKDDKRTYTYKATKYGVDKWIDVSCYVVERHTNGKPSMMMIGFSQADALATNKQELQARLNEDMQLIGGLASEYLSLYYFNIDKGIFKVYSLDGHRIPDTKKLVNEGTNPVKIFNTFGQSEAVHPDDRHLFADLNIDTIRERLAHSKKFTISFRRNFNGEYLWCIMAVIKAEAVNERANSITVGFAVRDAEIRSEQALSRCFSVLSKETSPEDAIHELLKTCGEFYGAERCYIFEYQKDNQFIANTFEWCADGVEPMIDRLQNVPSSEIDGWIEDFKTRGAYCMEKLNESAYSTPAGKELLEMQGIGSLIATPMMNGNRIVGLIGIDNPTKATQNIAVLHTVSAVAYSEVLRRKEDDEEHVTLEKLTDTFVSVYYTDLSRDYMHTWKIDRDYKDALGDVKSYSESMGDYVRTKIAVGDRERCIEMTSPEYIHEQFRTKDRFSIDMTDIMLGYERNFVFDYVKVSEDGDQFVVCCRNVTDSLVREKAQQQQLQDALAAADAANKSKTSFLFNMSHDIRTPMNAITGFTNMAIKHIDDREKALDSMTKAQQSGNMLLSLINSVLEVSRIESGNATLEEQPGDVYFSFVNIESTMRELAEAKDIDLTFEIANIKDRYVFCDYSRCLRIFVNVISNAIKYTRAGGYVKVRCEQVGKAVDGYGTYRYTVTDNGIGMSEEFQKHVFEQFAREKNSTVSGIQGTGLGMAVVKSFVDLMNGTIECQSKQGEGTTFTILLPFKIQDEEKYTDPLTGSVVSSVSENDVHVTYNFNGKTVLLVEDNELNREIAVEILEEEGLMIEEAADGSVAIDLLREKGPHYYDFILMDIQMPIMNGYAATQTIREMYPDVHIPIIALSANAFAEDKAASLAAGMDDHVAKPINMKELFGAMAKFLH